MMTTNRMFLIAFTVSLLAACGQKDAAEPDASDAGDASRLKVGFVYVTPISDAGWTHQHDLGRLQMEDSLGDQVETKYIENVPEGAEAERVIRQFAADGFDLVFTTSFGYMNPTIKVAEMFPDTTFEHATGYKSAANVGTYVARFYEGRYLSGIVAGKMTKSNVAGYVAAFPIPEVLRGINAFTLGMRSVNPDAEVKVIWTNSWFDPGREREAADVLITQGSDLVTHHTYSTAAVHAAELLSTAEPIDATRALAMGLLNELVPAEKLLDRAFETADRIAANAPLAVQATLHGIRELEGLSLESAYLRQEELGRPLRRTEDAREAQRAFVEKRPPRFVGR